MDSGGHNSPSPPCGPAHRALVAERGLPGPGQCPTASFASHFKGAGGSRHRGGRWPAQRPRPFLNAQDLAGEVSPWGHLGEGESSGKPGPGGTPGSGSVAGGGAVRGQGPEGRAPPGGTGGPLRGRSAGVGAAGEPQPQRAPGATGGVGPQRGMRVGHLRAHRHVGRTGHKGWCWVMKHRHHSTVTS